MDKYYSVKEVAELLKLPLRSVQRYIRIGELPAAKLGREYRISETDLEVFIDLKKKTSQETGKNV